MNTVAALIECEARELVPRVLSEDRRPVKLVAIDGGATPRQVENWKAGQNLPRIGHFIAMARTEPQLRAFIKRWLDEPADAESEAEFMRLWAAFQQAKGAR